MTEPSLVARVVAALDDAGIEHALIGAVALAAWGVARGTRDLDLMAVDERALDPATWNDLRAAGVSVEIRRAEPEDPLAGVVRVHDEADEVDVVLFGPLGWQARALSAAPSRAALGVRRVIGLVDLVRLKLYAGGPADAWDVHQLLDVHGDELVAQVEATLAPLPARARALWTRIRSDRGR